MSFLLDTDICSGFLKGDRRVWQKVMQHGGQLHVSAITIGELSTWASRKGVSPNRKIAIDAFRSDVTVLDVDIAVAEKFGEIRADFLDQGQGTPDMDLLIDATALIHNLTLVTHNTQDYVKVSGLHLADWMPDE